MLVLDTQHVSQLQRLGSLDQRKLSAKLNMSGRVAAITIVTPLEQFRGVLGRIHHATGADRLTAFAVLESLLAYYGRWDGPLLGYDDRASNCFARFSPPLIRRIGSMDAMIAAIALAHNATVLTANLADFRQVPGLVVEDWLRG